MPERKRPARGTTTTSSSERSELPREVARLATSVEKKKPATASKPQGAKARIVARLKRLHPMD